MQKTDTKASAIGFVKNVGIDNIDAIVALTEVLQDMNKYSEALLETTKNLEQYFRSDDYKRLISQIFSDNKNDIVKSLVLEMKSTIGPELNKGVKEDIHSILNNFLLDVKSDYKKAFSIAVGIIILLTSVISFFTSYQTYKEIYEVLRNAGLM